MKKNLIGIVLMFSISYSSYGQWQQCAGTAGLNMQSLLTNGIYNFAGGATGAYLSTNSSVNYVSSNSGNDAVGPTRGFTKDNNYVYTCTSQGVFRSLDNGATWISKSLGLTNLLTSGIINVGSNLFVVGPTGVFKSSDNADNWSAAGLSTTDIRSIAAINDTLFVGTNGAGIYKSVDWGVNWVSVNNGLGSATNFRAIESKGNTLFAAGPTGTGVFRSLDFGSNWILLSGGGLASGSYRGFASNSQLIVARSFGGGVFYSTDNGDNWTVINSGLTDLTIFDLELNDSYIIAATNTQGVFRFALSNLNLSTGIDDIIKNTIAIYPNPTTNQINIKTDTKLLGSIYFVYDNTGKSILSGRVDSENTVVKLGNLSGGIYLLRIGDTNFNQTFKVIKE